MTADAVPRRNSRSQPRAAAREERRARRVLTLPFALVVLLVAAAAAVVSYLLWPTWPSTPTALDAPAIPITVAGVLFDVPPAAIRAKVQRHPGQQERIDLVFEWPSLTPPQPDDRPTGKPLNPENAAAAAAATAAKRLFVTIAALGRGAAAARTAAHDLSALCRDASHGRRRWARHPAVPRRHAL